MHRGQPGGSRPRTSAGDGPAATPDARGIRQLPDHLDLRATVGPLAVGRRDPTLQLTAEGLWWACHTPAGAATVHVAVVGRQARSRAWGPGAELAIGRVDGLLGLHDDPTGLVTDHPLVGELQRRHRGVRLGRAASLTAVLPATVLGQRVTGRQAIRGWGAVVRRWGAPAPGPGATRGLRLPPAPAALAGVGYADLHPLGVERSRAEALRTASVAVERLEPLLGRPAPEAVAAVRRLPGLGPWTATTAVGLATGDPDLVVVGDLHLPSLVSWSLAGERTGDDDRMLELLAPFAGQRARVVRLLALGVGHPPRRAPRAAIPPIERW